MELKLKVNYDEWIRGKKQWGINSLVPPCNLYKILHSTVKNMYYPPIQWIMQFWKLSVWKWWKTVSPSAQQFSRVWWNSKEKKLKKIVSVFEKLWKTHKLSVKNFSLLILDKCEQYSYVVTSSMKGRWKAFKVSHTFLFFQRFQHTIKLVMNFFVPLLSLSLFFIAEQMNLSI